MFTLNIIKILLIYLLCTSFLGKVLSKGIFWRLNLLDLDKTENFEGLLKRAVFLIDFFSIELIWKNELKSKNIEFHLLLN